VADFNDMTGKGTVDKSTTGTHRGFRCQAFRHIHICETPNPNKEKAWVPSQRSHRLGFSLEG
jgi:hypothetical protein